MKNQKQQTTSETAQNIQGFIANTQVFVNEERQSITHRLSEDMRIEMPINYYKKVLGIPFEKKEKIEQPEKIMNKRNSYGLVARPEIFLTRDGQYLIHKVLGLRVSKHVNFYKKIFGVEFQPKVKSA